MEITISRLLNGIKTDLEGALDQISDYFEIEDIALYGQKIPLNLPPVQELYVYDYLYNDFDYPIVIVMGEGYNKQPKGTVSSPNLYYEDHLVSVKCLFRHSTTENPEMLTKGVHRYARAMEKIIRNRWDLRDENNSDPISKSCEILNVTFERPINYDDVFFRMFNISIRYKVLDYYFRKITQF